MPRTVLVSNAREAFDEGGDLKDERHVKNLVALGRAVVQAVRAGTGRA